MLLLLRNKKVVLPICATLLVTIFATYYVKKCTVQTQIQLDRHFYQRNVPQYKPDKVLLPYNLAAPDTVHIIWCGRKWFEFKHYLSVVSVLKVQQPHKIVLHYWANNPVLRDRNDYNLWYQDLTDEYFNIVSVKMGDNAPDCQNDSLMMSFVLEVLKHGGIYINDTVIVNRNLHSLMDSNFTVAVRDKEAGIKYSNLAFMIAPKSGVDASRIYKPDRLINCATSGEWENTTNLPRDEPVCLSVLRNYIPEKIMETGDAMSQKIRWLYYGSTQPRTPQWSMDDPITNIGHMVLLGGWEMNMLTYLSIRSMIHCVGAEQMFIYIDKEPKGIQIFLISRVVLSTKHFDSIFAGLIPALRGNLQYADYVLGIWYEKLKKEEPRAIFTYHEWPQTVFGKPIHDGSHASDLMRFDLLYKYGGMYVDWDAVFLKPLGDLRGYGFVTDFDWPDWHPPYPDVINNGVSAGKKGSEFLRKCLMKFRTYNGKKDWYYNGLMMPYKIYEQYPELVKIERKLQVICYNLKCHPVWLPGYHDEKINHLNQASFNWTEVYAFHWTRPSPPELLNMTLLKESKSMFAEVGRYVMTCDREKTLKKYNLS